MSRYETVKDKLKNQKAHLLETYGIMRIGIFGSVMRKTDSETSDIDLLYQLTGNRRIGFIEMDELEYFIRNLLNYDRIDLVNEDRLNPLFKKEVLENVEYV